jgi:hypothetical protein
MFLSFSRVFQYKLNSVSFWKWLFNDTIPDIIIVVRTTEYFYGSTIVKANGIRTINYFWLLLFNSYNALVKYLTLSFYRRFVTSSMLTTLRRKSTFESKKILERLSSFECLNPYRLFLKEKILCQQWFLGAAHSTINC